MTTCYENIRKQNKNKDNDTFYKILDYFNKKENNNINKYKGDKK